MDFNEYQKKATTTALYLDGVRKKYPSLPEEVYKLIGVTYVGLGLGEAGEVQNKLKKVIRDHQGEITPELQAAVKKELGDVLWYVATTCSELGLDMQDVAQDNIDKLFSRKERNVLTGDGDNR